MLNTLWLFLQDCWSRINARKGLLPKLWTLLRVGCKGSATVVGPNLLPLLSQVPASVVGDGLEFYHEWFSNMLLGYVMLWQLF